MKTIVREILGLTQKERDSLVEASRIVDQLYYASCGDDEDIVTTHNKLNEILEKCEVYDEDEDDEEDY